MAITNFKQSPVKTNGELPQVGDIAPDFTGVKQDLSELSLSELRGKRVVINAFPSLDTGVCAASVRRFNKEASTLNNTVVLCISKDLPFAQGRFCAAEGLENVITLSQFRCGGFEDHFGILMADGPLKGLLARAVFVIDENGKIIYEELVPEITEEPNYDKALATLK